MCDRRLRRRLHSPGSALLGLPAKRRQGSEQTGRPAGSRTKEDHQLSSFPPTPPGRPVSPEGRDGGGECHHRLTNQPQHDRFFTSLARHIVAGPPPFRMACLRRRGANRLARKPERLQTETLSQCEAETRIVVHSERQSHG